MGKLPVHPMSVAPSSAGNSPVLAAPYSLGCLFSYAKIHNGGELAETLDFRPITPTAMNDALEDLNTLGEAGVMVFSNYVWNCETNLRVARRAKELYPDCLVVFGGPHVPRHRQDLHQFLQENPFVDVAGRAEGELTFSEVLDAIVRTWSGSGPLAAVDLTGVLGITYRNDGRIVDNEDRPRIKHLETLPSPFLTGEFSHWISGTGFMPLETNRGCPYGCSFCDWGAATLTKIHTMSFERVFGEIEFAGQQRIEHVYVCDANFGILPRDEEIAEAFVRTHARYGFPVGVAYNNAKVANARLRNIIKRFHDAKLVSFGQISMQTTDEAVLDNIKRSNIKNAEYDTLVEFYRQEKIQTISELMVGLPGQTRETCRQDLQFMFDRRVCTRIFATQMAPNAPMNLPDYKTKFRLVVDSHGFVESSISFTREDYEYMVLLCRVFKLFTNVGLGILRYLTYFLQVEYSVEALDLIETWMRLSRADGNGYPASQKMMRHILRPPAEARHRDLMTVSWTHQEGRSLFEGFPNLVEEVLAIAESELGARFGGADVNAVAAVQRAVIPFPGTFGRADLQLEHDVVGYFRDLNAVTNVRQRPVGLVPLRDRGPGVLCVRPGPRRDGMVYNDYFAPSTRFELASDMEF